MREISFGTVVAEVEFDETKSDDVSDLNGKV